MRPVGHFFGHTPTGCRGVKPSSGAGLGHFPECPVHSAIFAQGRREAPLFFQSEQRREAPLFFQMTWRDDFLNESSHAA